MQTDRYISPLSTRYASAEMQYLFSQDFKFRTWRRLWIALARAEKTLGLAITDEQIAELEAHRDDINYAEAEAREREVRHDVMSHVYAYGLQCPKAAGIIHLGATSCYVGDNTDLIILREAAQLVVKKAVQVVRNLSAFADRWKDTPCLGYTHLQPAQLTTVGKRAALWINELLMDTGLGRDGYSIIGQGRIAEIVSGKSNERREIFEEAAGISRYRYRKEESERKLARTEENLLRINDKVDELELQVEPLRKQAETAKKYLRLRDELKSAEVSVWMETLDRLHAQAETVNHDYQTAKENLAGAQRELEQLYACLLYTSPSPRDA